MASGGRSATPPRLFDREQAARRRDFLINLLYAATWTVLLGGVVWLLGRWLLPFVLAFATAAALQRPLRWLCGKTRASRRFSSGVLVVAAVLLMAAVLALLGWWLWRKAVGFFGDEAAVTELTDTIAQVLETLRDRLAGWSARLSPATRAALQAVLGEWGGDGGLFREWLSTAATGILRFVAKRLPGVVFGFVIWVIASVFLTVDHRRVMGFLHRQIPAHRQALADDVCTLFGGTVGKLLRAYLLLMLITFVELAVGFWLLKVPDAPVLAAVVAVVDVLPVLGVGTVLIPWAVVSLLVGEGASGVWLLVLYLIITIVRNVAEPHLIGERVGLPPLITLLCLYLGWQAAGLIGVVLMPLAATVLVQLQKRGHLPLWK